MRFTNIKLIETGQELEEKFNAWLKTGNETRIICDNKCLTGGRCEIDLTDILANWRNPTKNQRQGLTGCYDIRIKGNAIYLTRNVSYEYEHETFAYIRL